MAKLVNHWRMRNDTILFMFSIKFLSRSHSFFMVFLAGFLSCCVVLSFKPCFENFPSGIIFTTETEVVTARYAQPLCEGNSPLPESMNGSIRQILVPLFTIVAYYGGISGLLTLWFSCARVKGTLWRTRTSLCWNFPTQKQALSHCCLVQTSKWPCWLL